MRGYLQDSRKPCPPRASDGPHGSALLALLAVVEHLALLVHRRPKRLRLGLAGAVAAEKPPGTA
jgi:hypothetical protein